MQIVTDSHISQEHIQEVIVQQKFFEIISNYPIGYAVSTFHKKGLEKKSILFMKETNKKNLQLETCLILKKM